VNAGNGTAAAAPGHSTAVESRHEDLTVRRATMSNSLRQLADEGVAVWLDDMGRERLVSGSLRALVRDSFVVGVTTNPTIFQKAISGSEVYADQLHDLAGLKVPVPEAIDFMIAHDVRAVCDLLRPVYDRTEGIDGRVSIEVDPLLAEDTDRTIAEARLLWWMVDRPNLMIKIPATDEGLPAVTACLAEGISVNVTLIFSLARYVQVVEAYLTGLEQARAKARDLSSISSVASFFVSRVDTEVDRRLEKIGTPEASALRGQAAIANARLAYQYFEEVLSSSRWEALEAADAMPQRPLWASTGVKDPAYDPTRYVVELVAPHTVNTMPEPTLRAVAQTGVIRGDTIRGSYQQAQQVFEDLRAVGVDFDDVVAALEADGVEKFQTSWKELIDSVSGAMGARR
jgi:transaldolase